MNTLTKTKWKPLRLEDLPRSGTFEAKRCPRCERGTHGTHRGWNKRTNEPKHGKACCPACEGTGALWR